MFILKYKSYLKFLIFLLISILFLSYAGIQIVPGPSGHPLDWQLQLGKIITFPLFLILKGIIAVLFGFWLSKRTIAFSQQNIKRLKHLDATTQSIVINIIQVFVYFIFFITVLDILNLQSSSITFIASAAAFGVSLGLRQIASNLISGFVLLLERSINVGDFVEVKDRGLGFVRRIGTLYTHIELTDGKEVLIPNGDIFSYITANWTLNHKQTRIELDLVINFDQDVSVVRDLCYKVMNAHPYKSKHYEPDVFVDRFGEYGLVLRLYFWLDDIFLGRNRVKSELLFSVCKELQDANIKLPTCCYRLDKNTQITKN